MAEKLTTAEFAKRIREKHPGAYDDIADGELTDKVLAKYPEYGDMVSRGAALTPAQRPGDELQTKSPLSLQGVTISATPKSSGMAEDFERWATQVAHDLRAGTDVTLPGRVMKFMGAPGLEKGTTSGVADIMGSPLLGPTKMAEGGAQVAQEGKRWEGTKNIVSGALQTATIPGAFVAPEASEATLNATGRAVKAGISKIPIPSKTHAAEGFQEVMGAAKNIPVELTNAEPAILRLMDWQRKTQLGPTINKFLNRVTKGDAMKYDEARDFYQLLTKLSVDESKKLPAAVGYELKRMVAGFKADIGNAAGTVGKSGQYYDAMSEFAKASRLREFAEKVKELGTEQALKWAAGAIGVGAGYGVYKKLSD